MEIMKSMNKLRPNQGCRGALMSEFLTKLWELYHAVSITSLFMSAIYNVLNLVIAVRAPLVLS
jgi:hypothetical protein